MTNNQYINLQHQNFLFRGIGSFLLFLFFTFSLSAIDPFHFALLTDLHITQNTTAVEDLENSVRQINNTPTIEFVLVTGDITEFGDSASLKKAKEVLDKLSVPYYITSGNHETIWNDSEHTDFAKIFGDDKFAFQHKGVWFFGFNTGPFSQMTQGHVSSQDITWLKNNLAKIDKSTPIVLATHYPLLNGDVDNWQELTDAVKTHNIRAILGGHYHRNAIFSYEGIPGLINRSNLRGKDDVGGYSIYSITADSLIVCEQTIGGEPQRWAEFSMKENYFTQKDSVVCYSNIGDTPQKIWFSTVKKGWSRLQKH